MDDYEICILNETLKPKTFVALSESSDTAAIQAGIRVAAGRAVEIWRGLDCIYRAVPGEGPISRTI
jgi:hypothetical protein